MVKTNEIYDLMLDKIALNDATINEMIIGLTWTYCNSVATGLCMTADTRSRTFEWSGSLQHRSINEVATWIRSWDPMKSSIAMAAINSVLNQRNSIKGKPLQASNANPNLAVFDYFLPLIKDKKSVVVGRYPGLEVLQTDIDLQVIELNPDVNDLPATACEYIIPDAEWVFLTGTSIANKTFPRLMELSRNSNVVLMGPSVPHLQELADFGVDFIAGVNAINDKQLKQVVAEGGGVNIFTNAVQYFVHDLGLNKMDSTRLKIAEIVRKREKLKDEMELWYQNVSQGSFPKTIELIALDEE